MTLVLGIDAAWTQHHPSGVCLVCANEAGARVLALAPSYRAFLGAARGEAVAWGAAAGEEPPVGALIEAAERIGAAPLDVVAVDMPLARTPITGRRPSDDLVSRVFGRAKCSTHSPQPHRPGARAERLRDGFAAQGLALATAADAPGRGRALIEVYPHVALLRLCRRDERLPYKVAKSSRYWPGTPVVARIGRLLAEWRVIVDGLSGAIEGVETHFPVAAAAGPGTLAALKPYEDGLDALVCAWVGLRFAQGQAKAYGDATAAIWAPT